MEGITLHQKLGLNPRLTFCVRCGGETNELALLGNKNWIYKCGDCGAKFVGGAPVRCPKCGGRSFDRDRELSDGERIPSGDLCDKCKAQLEELKQVVEEGGVFWRCSDCGSEGAIRKSDFADEVRKAANILTGQCGVQFSKKDCPVCGKDATGGVMQKEGR